LSGRRTACRGIASERWFPACRRLVQSGTDGLVVKWQTKLIEEISNLGLDVRPRSQPASVIRRFDSEVLVDKTVLAARRRHGGNVVAHDEPDHVSILAVKVDIDR
jgi:hypothetical protein